MHRGARRFAVLCLAQLIVARLGAHLRWVASEALDSAPTPPTYHAEMLSILSRLEQVAAVDRAPALFGALRLAHALLHTHAPEEKRLGFELRGRGNQWALGGQCRVAEGGVHLLTMCARVGFGCGVRSQGHGTAPCSFLPLAAPCPPLRRSFCRTQTLLLSGVW
jgi:hypothetical protein